MPTPDFTELYYQCLFETFLACSDEKEILLAHIQEIIGRREIKSLLDIGAGNGLISVSLAQTVSRYVAVETNGDYVQKLRGAGTEVVHDFFPCAVVGKFDMVLACHSLPWESKDFRQFLICAWPLVKNGGILCAVTCQDSQNDWAELLMSCDFPPRRSEEGNPIAVLAACLFELGAIDMSLVTSHVTAGLDEMIRALSFVYGRRTPAKTAEFLDRRNRVALALQKYRTGDMYHFPFEHVIITAEKD